MANADYSLAASGSFCPLAVLAYPVSQLEAALVLTDVREPSGVPISVGMTALIGREIVQVTAVTLPTITVKRGCADTVPWTHSPGVVIFFVTGTTAVHRREFAGTETVAVKLLAKSSSGRVPIDYAPPNDVTFSLRFARPYAPAQVKSNGDPWHIGHYVTPTTPLSLTWVHRNRVLQDDQILGHADGGVPVEAGTTYRVRMLLADGTVKRELTGITGTSFTYPIEDAATDFELTPGTGEFEGYLVLHAVRDGLISWQGYQMAFRVDRSQLGGGTTGNFLALEGAGRMLKEDGSRIALE